MFGFLRMLIITSRNISGSKRHGDAIADSHSSSGREKAGLFVRRSTDAKVLPISAISAMLFHISLSGDRLRNVKFLSHKAVMEFSVKYRVLYHVVALQLKRVGRQLHRDTCICGCYLGQSKPSRFSSNSTTIHSETRLFLGI